MKILMLILSCFWIVPSFLFSQNVEIRSLRAYAGNSETSFPAIFQKGIGPDKLTIEFDAQSDFTPNLLIIFRFCNRNWIPYKNIFLVNPNNYIDYNMTYSILPNTVKEAHYHFKSSYPDSKGFITFPFSGKWMYYIVPSGDTANVLGYGKFYVINQIIGVRDSLRRSKLEGKIYFPADLAKTFDISASFSLPGQLNPANVDHVEIVSNHVINYPTVIDRSGNTVNRQYYWNGSNKFSFTARDILPGNEYREVDLRNTDKFIGKNVQAHLDGLEYSRFYTEGSPDLYGGSILTNYNNDYATYLNVKFSIRPPNQVTGGIYLVGAFNNWTISPEYKMQDNYGVYSTTISLKRGIYDYQYVIADDNNGTITNQDWVTLEGNNWTTSNVYHVFVYYKDPDYGGYDRIIGYQQIKSR